MDGMQFSDADIQAMMNSPIYREIVANVQAAIAEKVRENAMAAERNRIEEMRRAPEGFLDEDVGAGRQNVLSVPGNVRMVDVPHVKEMHGTREAVSDEGVGVSSGNVTAVSGNVGTVDTSCVETVYSVDQVQPIEVGELDVVTREYNRFESTIGFPRKCADILSTSESYVVEECISVNDMLSRNASGNTVDLSVAEVTDRTLECALGVPCYPSIGRVRPVGVQMVRVADGDVELAFGPAARYLRGVLGSGVAVGVFLAWYARAVARGYAGSVVLERDGVGWRIVPVRREPLDCLRSVIKSVGVLFSPTETKVQLRCENVNPHKVLHPYERLRREFPNDCCAELLSEPYSHVVCAVTDTFIGDGLDVAVGSYVGRGLTSYTLENTCFLYTCPVSGQGVELSDEALKGFGRCAEYLALNRVDGKVALAVYVAWCIWLARRGVIVSNELCYDGGRWHVEPRQYESPMDAAVAMLTVAAEGFFDTGRPGGSMDLRRVENVCGFRCLNVSGALVDYRFLNLEDSRTGSRPGTRVYV